MQQMCRVLVLLRTYSGREGKRELRRHGAHRRVLDAALCQALLRVVLAGLRPSDGAAGAVAAVTAALPAAAAAGIPAAAPSARHAVDRRRSLSTIGSNRWLRASPAPKKKDDARAEALALAARALRQTSAGTRDTARRWK